MRSYLFVPADSERKLAKAADIGADCLLIDLEDSVSHRRKSEARAMAHDYLLAACDRVSGPKLIVRVNALNSGLIEEDLAAVIPAAPHGILLPKAEGGADVQHLATLIEVAEVRAGLASGSTRIHAIVSESAVGVLKAGTYNDMTPRLEAMSWGGEDLSADLGVATNRDEAGRYTDVFRYARSLTLLGSAAAGVMAVDTVFTDFRDSDGLEAECRAAVRDGFSGKLAIHPGQVKIINRVFTPEPEAIARATKIVSLFEEAGEEAGVLSLDGKMIDRPHLKQAERILARARAAGLISA